MKTLFIFMLIGLICLVPTLLWVIFAIKKEIDKKIARLKVLECFKYTAKAEESIKLAESLIVNTNELIAVYRHQRIFAMFLLLVAIYSIFDCILFNL